MTDSEKTFLCGGVLFFMLMKTTFPDGSARDHKDGIKDEHKAPDVMADLVYTFTGTRSYVSEKDTSNYRECKIEGTVNVPFADPSIILAYDETIRHRYRDALQRMCEFSRWHLNPAMKEWLVRALIEIVEYDEDIPDSAEFYALRDGSAITKDAVCGSRDFELEPFLVGVLHYILVNRSGKNQDGLPTLDFYGDKKPHKERIHKGNAGQRITRNISVTLYEFEDDGSREQSANETDQGFIPEEDDIPEFESIPESESEKEKVTMIQHQTNVIQNGENNFNLTNNGVMNFDFGGGKK